MNHFYQLLNSGSVGSRLAIARCVADVTSGGYASQSLMRVIQNQLQDKDADVRQEARLAIDNLARNNQQAEELVTKWIQKGPA
jgi:hypothetical protein